MSIKVYSSLTETKCGWNVNNTVSGFISTPNFPDPYPPGITCEWTIDTIRNHTTFFLIPRLSLPFDVPCADYLVIRENKNPNSVYTYETCESNSDPIVIVARSAKLYIKFHSSSIQGAGGFKMRFGGYKGIKTIVFNVTRRLITVIYIFHIYRLL